MKQEQNFTQELSGLKEEQKNLSKAVYANISLFNEAKELGESIKDYTSQLEKYTGKLEHTLEQASRALLVLQKLTEGETQFTHVLNQYAKDGEGKAEAFGRFVESIMQYREAYARFEKRLSASMEVLDSNAKGYLEKRQKQLDQFYEQSIAQFTHFVATEKDIFEKSIAQLKPKGIHHAIEQLELLTPIHEHLKQLELSEEGAMALTSISNNLKSSIRKNDAFHKEFFQLMEKQEKTQILRFGGLIGEIRNLKYVLLFQSAITVILFIVLLLVTGILG